MSIKGLLFYSFLNIILSIYFINTKNYYVFIAEAIILFVVFRKYGVKSVIMLIMIFGFFCFYRINSKPYVESQQTQEIYEIKEAKPKYLIVKKDNIDYLAYLDNQESVYDKQDQIEIKGYVKEIESDLDIDVFDFKDYLNNKRIYYQIDNPVVVEHISSSKLSSTIVNKITSRLEGDSYKMTKMLLFNDKYADIDSYDNLKSINALHLFVVSGFHISFFFSLLTKLFRKQEIVGFVIASIICTFYVFLLDFSISSTRALVSLISFRLLNKYLNKIDCVALPGIIFLLIEPLNIYNYSFILSFLMSIIISMSNSFLNKQNKIIQVFLLSLICFISMIPIQLIFNYKVNFISLLSNILLSYVVMVIFVLCIVGMIISFLNGNVFSFVYSYFNVLVAKIANIKSTITFGSISFLLVCLFYLLLFVFLYLLTKSKYKGAAISFMSIVGFMVCLYNRSYFNINQQVTFLNVYQGDCTIIQDSFSSKVMLIDTGGLQNYDIASKKIMPYLEYHGIRKIDTVVITHDDFDHNGALDSLINLIPIDNIIQDNKTKEVILGKISLTNVNHYFTDSSSDNDKSIVLYGKIGTLNYIFTGDASSKIEKEIIKENIDVDVLKVGHHGSKSSTCEQFVKEITPKYGIISVGKNYYGHPNKEVLDILDKYDVKTYRTDINGTIRFKDNKITKLIIETAN